MTTQPGDPGFVPLALRPLCTDKNCPEAGELHNQGSDVMHLDKPAGHCSSPWPPQEQTEVRCCVCGQVTADPYRNYMDQPFCRPCSNGAWERGTPDVILEDIKELRAVLGWSFGFEGSPHEALAAAIREAAMIKAELGMWIEKRDPRFGNAVPAPYDLAARIDRLEHTEDDRLFSLDARVERLERVAAGVADIAEKSGKVLLEGSMVIRSALKSD